MALSITSGANTKGAARVFEITELLRVGTALSASGEKFIFSTDNFAMPRGPWSYGVKLRTVRRDLPGSEEPVEQVLGWSYTPFQIAGVWDDRHGGADYATNTRRAFEKLIQRGRPIRLMTEELAVMGLITDLEITRVRKDLIGYKFTFSPHQRYERETVRTDASKDRKVTSDPRTSVKKARTSLEALAAAQARATTSGGSAVQQKLSTGVFGEINADLADLAALVGFAENTVENEILKAEEVANALNRGAQTMASVKTAVFRLLNRTRALTSTITMAGSTVVDTLDYESWKRGLNASARQLVVTAGYAEKDFALRAQPKPTRLHRVRPGETLYAISTRYYGTPHQWRRILSHNHLSSIILEGGELLEIPELR